MTSVSVRCRIAAFFLVFAAAGLARAELPQLDPAQTLGPDSSDAVDDANTLPSPPLFGYGLALQGNMALAGMPGAYDEKGRVAALVRNSAGKWVRFQTLTASGTPAGSGFGEHIAICNMCSLISSRTAVYIFKLQSGRWSEVGKLAFGRAVQVRDLDVHWNTVVVGASDTTGDAVYVFHMNTDGTFTRISRVAAPDAVASDRFGERVAVYGSTVAVTAPGWHSGQGAAYVFSCSDTQCVQRQKVIAHDGRPGDDFGHAVDLANGVLVVGAPEANWVPGDPSQPPSETNHRAGGSAYLFVRSGTAWTEHQKLHPGARQLNWYASFGLQVAVSGTHVVIGAPYQVDEYEPGFVVDYQWSGGTPGGSLFAARMMVNDTSHGESLALDNNLLLAGIPEAPPYWGGVAYYKLPAH